MSPRGVMAGGLMPRLRLPRGNPHLLSYRHEDNSTANLLCKRETGANARERQPVGRKREAHGGNEFGEKRR